MKLINRSANKYNGKSFLRSIDMDTVNMYANHIIRDTGNHLDFSIKEGNIFCVLTSNKDNDFVKEIVNVLDVTYGNLAGKMLIGLLNKVNYLQEGTDTIVIDRSNCSTIYFR